MVRIDHVPDPAASGGQVVVDVEVASVNYPDVLLATGRLRPRVTASFPLDRVGEALQTVADRRVLGKAVVMVSPGRGRGELIRERLHHEL